MAKSEEGRGGAVGALVGTVVLAATCAVGGWVARELWPEKKGAPAGAPPPGAAQTASVEPVQARVYNRSVRTVAHAEAMQEVDLMPQVDGYVKEIKFEEGQVVKEGQLLYVLDDERYQAVVNQRRADLEAAEAEARRASRYYSRMQQADARGVTELERDNAEAAAESARAKVLQAKANLIVAEYDCKKAHIYAPISGQIGKSSAYVGDYVSPSKGALAKIVQIDPIRVSFPMTDREYVAWRQAQRAGTAAKLRMRLVLPDGSEYPHEGTFDFDDNQMSRETATIMMRLTFPNPDRLLVPNSYVSLVADLAEPPSYPSLPQAAVMDLPGGSLGVFTVSDDGTVHTAVVETLPAQDGFVPVTKGLEVGARVVTAGVRKLRDGMKVELRPATPTEENDPSYKPTVY